MTGLCTQRLGFTPNYLSLHPTTGLFTQLLGFEPEYWTSTDYWAFPRLLGFYPNAGDSPKAPNPFFCIHYTGVPSQSGHGHVVMALVARISGNALVTMNPMCISCEQPRLKIEKYGLISI